MAPPIVQGIDRVVLLNDELRAGAFFTAEDPDGDPIERYRFTDDSSSISSGRFELDGVGQQNGSTTTIEARDLNRLFYIGGSSIATETLFVSAFAGGIWSLPIAVTAYSARSQSVAPIVEAEDFSVLSPELMPATEIFSAFDPDGWPIATFRLRDRLDGAGKWWFKGEQMEQGKLFNVPAAEIDQLFYQGANSATSEFVDIFALDGSQRSERRTVRATTRPNFNRPVVFFDRLQVPRREEVDLFPMIRWADADGNTPKRIRLLDTSPQDFSYYLTVNGRRLNPQQWFEVSQANFDSIKLVGADRIRSSLLRVQINDGRHLSAIQSIEISTVDRPIVAADQFIVQEHLEQLELGDIFDQIDAGPSPSTYRIVDGNDEFTSGRFQLGTTTFSAETVHELNATEFNNLRFRTAVYGVRQIDDIYVQADNGTFSSRWKRVEVSTEPNYDEYQLRETGPGNFNDWTDWRLAIDTPGIITYSFMQTFDYNPGELSSGNNVADVYRPFSAEQRRATRYNLAELEKLLNVEFVEVADQGVDAAGRRGGLIRLGNFVDPDDGIPQTISFEPDDTQFRPEGGDIWVNAAKYDISDVSLGSLQQYVFLGELAHAMGISFAQGPIPGEQAWSNFSVQNSFLTRFFIHGGFEAPSSLMHYDVHALQKLYGANANSNIGDNLYDFEGWLENDTDRIMNIWDGGGTDTLSAEGAFFDAEIDLREGQFSSYGFTDPADGPVVEVPENISIAWGTAIENAIGGENNDTIIGNHYINDLAGGLGNDDIWSGAGNDIMKGGGGDDIYRYHVADDDDVIDEERSGGLDQVSLESFPTMDSFSGDLAFRTGGDFNRDLIIDLVLDGGETQGTIQIKNQRWGLSRVETLSFNGVAVDLTELYSQATKANQSFELLDTSTGFGRLVRPLG